MDKEQEAPKQETSMADIRTVRFFSPLEMDHYRYDCEKGVSEYPTRLDGFYGAEFEYVINAAIEKENDALDADRGLMKYYCENDSIGEKVISAFPTTEEFDNTLWGVMECKVRGALTKAETELLKDYFETQYSNVWGAEFKQHDKAFLLCPAESGS